ncbi:MAG TPA: ATP-binding protein [Anaerolineae bacterium]|nr:ATP-binding protein [Anaerolineae bacterium]
MNSEDLSLDAFLEQTRKEYAQTEQELKEIDTLIKQSNAEVERLAQRSAQVTNYIRQMQPNFDTLPRSDIKEGYEALQNAQQRLFTMRGHLEKLQSDQRNLERLHEYQRQVLALSGGLGAISSGDDSGSGVPAGATSDVVRIIQAQETERQSLVRRLHDGPASSLSNFILQAEICQRFFDSDPERARNEINELKGGAAATFNVVKDFIFELRPMMLDDLGVVPTLRRYVEATQEKANFPISLNVTGMERRMEGHIEVTLFRGVQELVNNARNHGRPSQIQVRLDLDDNEAKVVVEDNGSGFNSDEVLRDKSGSFGLSTLRDRIKMLGGKFDIESSLGQGSRLEFSLPVGTTSDIL